MLHQRVNIPQSRTQSKSEKNDIENVENIIKGIFVYCFLNLAQRLQVALYGLLIYSGHDE